MVNRDKLVSLSESSNLPLDKNQLHLRQSKVYMRHGTKENLSFPVLFRNSEVLSLLSLRDNITMAARELFSCSSGNEALWPSPSEEGRDASQAAGRIDFTPVRAPSCG